MNSRIAKSVESRITVISVLAALILLVFSNSLMSEFVWDDIFIMKKAIFTDWNNIGTILTVADTAAEGDNTSYYRPMTYLTFLWDYQMWELKPFWYNLENLLIHALVTILLFLLIAKISADNLTAFAASVLFAIHPAVTEPVNFIAGGRNTMLCAAFALGSLLLLVHSGAGKRKWALLSLASYFLALLSKEQAITLPVFLLCVTVLSKSEKYKVDKYLLAGFFAITGGYLILRSSILGSAGSEFDINMSEQSGIIANALFEYFRIMLYPVYLNIEYMTLPLELTSIKFLSAAGAVIALIIMSIRRNTPDILRAAGIWLVLNFLLISNIIPIPSASVADRYIYIPLLGMCLGLGYVLKYLYEKKQIAAVVVFLISIIILGALTHTRNYAWQTQESMWLDVVKKSPEKAVGYYNLGVIYKDGGDKVRAIQQNLLALERDPDYFLAHINLGILYHSQGLVDKAIGKFQEAINSNPDFATSYYNLALAYHSRGHIEKAIAQYKNAIELKTDYAQAYNNMGSAYTSKGNIDEAIKHYKSAIQHDPESANAHNNLGSAYRSKGMLDDAIREYNITLKLNPNHTKAIANLRFARTMKAYSQQKK